MHCYTRDGSAIELVGLCYAVVHWLSNQYSKKVYPHRGVLKDDGEYFTYANWADMIKVCRSISFAYCSVTFYGNFNVSQKLTFSGLFVCFHNHWIQ